MPVSDSSIFLYFASKASHSLIDMAVDINQNCTEDISAPTCACPTRQRTELFHSVFITNRTTFTQNNAVWRLINICCNIQRLFSNASIDELQSYLNIWWKLTAISNKAMPYLWSCLMTIRSARRDSIWTSSAISVLRYSRFCLRRVRVRRTERFSFPGDYFWTVAKSAAFFFFEVN